MDKIIAIFAEQDSYDDAVVFIAVNLLQNLAQSKETHVNLLKPEIIDSIIGSLKARSKSGEKDSSTLMMLK